MPITAKLSRKFYERLGDDIANELVDWFNTVDATYRDDLRTLNELNFQRFDAKLEQRFAQADLDWERRFAGFQLKVEQRFARMEGEMERRFAQVDAKIEQRTATLIKWMFGFWIATLVPLAGLVVTLRLF